MNKIQADFSRKHPKDIYARDGLPDGWFAIRYEHIPKANRRQWHGRWLKISSDYGVIYRAPRFSATMLKTDIALDWVGWLHLNGRREKLDDVLPLEISPINYFCLPFIYWKIIETDVNPMSRLAGWVSLISLFLGILSLVLAFCI